jgi:hypothetical protein
MTTTKPIVIALVLKTGGDVYDYKYVNNIVAAIKENIGVPHRIVCLTDDKRKLSTDIDYLVRFRHNWPKWWGKIELFTPNLFDADEQVFFFDLDTFIVGDLDEILGYRGEFCALRDFYRPHTMGSGLMSWHGTGVYKIYNTFVQHDMKYMNNIREGDQAFIDQHRPSMDYFQDLFTGKVVSYKVHCLEGQTAAVPTDSRIICFHGKPRPHEIETPLKHYWKQDG